MTSPICSQVDELDSRFCFVIMPFGRDMSNVYEVIRNTAGDCGLRCKRADEFSRSERITDDIRNGIARARIIVADLTGRNPNVFYELGLAHALKKQVVLLTQKAEDVPFDIKELRYVEYDPHEPLRLRRELTKFLREGISTIPNRWDRNFYPPNWTGGYIKIVDCKAPDLVSEGQPFEIRVTAKNNGKEVPQAYFSVSFPDGIEELSVESNVNTIIGRKGDYWAGERYILEYPIAEGFIFAGEPSKSGVQAWGPGWIYHLRVRGYAKKKGLFWFYVNACCAAADGSEWIWDPFGPTLDVDQRQESVYCGVVEVV